MVEIARMVAFNRMAPPAQGSYVPDEGHFFVSCGLLIRLFFVAIQTHLDVQRPVSLDLLMCVQRLILFLVMTAVAEIRFPGVRRPSEGIAVKYSFYTLPIYIVAGAAGENPALQREVGRDGQVFIRLGIDFQWMAVAGRHPVMTTAQ